MGGGGPTQSSASYPMLYSYRDILPPWTRKYQKQTVPWLMERAQMGGLSPQEQKNLWGQARESIESSSMGAQQQMARQLATSGLSPSSPMAAGAFADLASDKMSTTSKAALDFAKMKMGAKDTAIGQLMTALYTPPPVAVGNYSQGSSGGGK